MGRIKTWGEIYRQRVRRGYDHGYAAWLADRYVERRGRPPARQGDAAAIHGGAAEIEK